ncbi:hypothetical protein GGS26DRAFT_4788 [Hypomontagnella submonticulosa]|nr:hypothetical protein GGS26DRAFT_4788 [Hypomontagnella submonticulosa]
MDLNAPALPPPDGITPNFDNPPNANDLAWGVLMACAAISTICVILRFYGRVFLLRKVQAEEIMVILAYGNFWGAEYATLRMIDKPGYFVHQWDLRIGALIPTAYYVLVFGVCYSVVLPLLKCAILVEWCRMFVPKGNRNRSPFYWGCVIIIFLQVAGGISIIVALCFQCVPHQAIWDLTITDKKCFDLGKLQVFSASFQLVCDIGIFLLPQHVIWSLRMTWQKRLGVSVIFGLGLLACVSAAFRLATTVAYGQTTDGTYTIGPLLFWATAEMACGFFIICIPCIPKILKDTGVIHRIKKVFGATSNTKSNQKSDFYGTGSLAHGKSATTTSKAYYKLDEDGVPLRDMKSDSTEVLHTNDKPNNGIVLTTRITVNTQETHSVSDSDDMHMGAKAAWAR